MSAGRPISAGCERKFVDMVLGEVEPDGSFAGYASLFNRVDLGKDVVERGAFARSSATPRSDGSAQGRHHDEIGDGSPVDVRRGPGQRIDLDEVCARA